MPARRTEEQIFTLIARGEGLPSRSRRPPNRLMHSGVTKKHREPEPPAKRVRLSTPDGRIGCRIYNDGRFPTLKILEGTSRTGIYLLQFNKDMVPLSRALPVQISKNYAPFALSKIRGILRIARSREEGYATQVTSEYTAPNGDYEVYDDMGHGLRITKTKFGAKLKTKGPVSAFISHVLCDRALGVIREFTR